MMRDEQGLTFPGLAGCKLKIIIRVVVNYEIDRTIAKIADAVEDDNRRHKKNVIRGRYT